VGFAAVYGEDDGLGYQLGRVGLDVVPSGEVTGAQLLMELSGGD
jgi:hypothetical protein